MDTLAPSTTTPAATARRRRNPVLRFVLGFWKWLRRMRNAIILLLTLAAGASVGSFIPQRPINELAVLRWKQARPVLGEWFEHVGMFDVYGSLWFMTIYLLLMVSLVSCVLPRIRAFARVVRSRPRPGGKGEHVFEGATPLEPQEALDAVERALRGRRWRVARSDGAVSAEKGRLREGGSLVFHVALLLMLLAVGAGRAWGFSGQVAIVEGDQFFDTHVAYDSIREGSMFDEGHRGFTLKVDDFNVAFRPDGSAKQFVSRVKLSRNDVLIADTDIRVNNPLVHDGVSIYQLAWGWAPRITVKQNGKPLADANVVFLPEGRIWRGVVKIPQTKPQQTGVEMFFFPDFELGPGDQPRNKSPLPNRPVVLYQSWLGDLGLTAPQSVYSLDKRLMVASDLGVMPKGSTQKLANGVEIAFEGLKQYTVFQIASDPGQGFALVAAAFILVGLIPSLYSSRRRVWVKAAREGQQTRVTVNGLALQRKGAFEPQFAALVRDIGRSLSEKTTT